MDNQLITADNIGTSLSFNEKLTAYEDNVAKLSEFDAKINAIQRELEEIRVNNQERRKESNAYYPPQGLPVEELEHSTGEANSIFVYKKRETNEEFDKLYGAFGNITVVQRDTRAMKVLNDKFPGITDYFTEVANYFYTSFDEIDKEETNKLREHYVEQSKKLRVLKDDRDIVANKVLDVERFINTAEKVSNIGKFNEAKYNRA